MWSSGGRTGPVEVGQPSVHVTSVRDARGCGASGTGMPHGRDAACRCASRGERVFRPVPHGGLYPLACLNGREKIARKARDGRPVIPCRRLLCRERALTTLTRCGKRRELCCSLEARGRGDRAGIWEAEKREWVTARCAQAEEPRGGA